MLLLFAAAGCFRRWSTDCMHVVHACLATLPLLGALHHMGGLLAAIWGDALQLRAQQVAASLAPVPSSANGMRQRSL